MATSGSVALGRERTAPRGTNLDNVRRHNLSHVLTLVHTRRSVSRAQLTRELGLNRSTIAALVSELASLGLVVETDPGQTNQVGRPSLVIEPSGRVVAICVNPELDAITIGIVGLGGQVVRRVRFDNVRVPSPVEAVNVVNAVLAGMSTTLENDYRVVGVGIAVPGLVRGSDGLVDLAPHLGWRDEPFAQMLADSTGYAVVAANDASCGAIAEHTFGAGRGVDDMIYLNGGASGIGGGVIVDSTLLAGANGYAGEFGHTLVKTDGALCHCGATGCLETEVSRKPLLDALGLGDAQAEQLDAELAAQFEAGPSPELEQLVRSQARFLVIALRNAINMFNPRRIVLGGFLGSLLRVVPEEFDAVTKQSPMIGAGGGVELMGATLGSSILMVGAAELAFADLLADPARSASTSKGAVSL